MKIWFEALTGKQSLLMHYLAIKFEKQGHTCFITTRPYSIDRSNTNLDRLKRKHHPFGLYGGALLQDKLIAGSKRIIELTEFIVKKKPDLLIAFPSPDAFRIAFGLGIKTLQINDTPHAFAPAKLTISLSNALIFSEAIEEKEFAIHGVSQFYTYKGVDEVLWIKEFQESKQVLEELNLIDSKYIVVRCEESKAGYFQRMNPSYPPGSTIVTNIVKKIQEENLELKIVAFPRYPEQEEELKRLNVIVPDSSVDTLNLFRHALAVMTGGGTMGREAALLGTPTLYSFPLKLAVNDYLIEMGFPLYHHVDLDTIKEKLISLSNTPKMDDQRRQLLINQMETPFEGLQKAIKELGI